MVNEAHQSVNSRGMSKGDVIGSISLILGGNFLKTKIDKIINSIYVDGGDPELWAFMLRFSSIVSMWIGVAVGCVALYKFVRERIDLYNEKKKQNRNIKD